MENRHVVCDSISLIVTTPFFMYIISTNHGVMHVPIYKQSPFYIFGALKFPNVARLLAHFDHHPIIAGPTG